MSEISNFRSWLEYGFVVALVTGTIVIPVLMLLSIYHPPEIVIRLILILMGVSCVWLGLVGISDPVRVMQDE